MLGRHGAHAAKPVQPVTRSERDTVTTRDLQMEGKTALNWARRVKHSCANRGHHAMVRMAYVILLIFVITPHAQLLKRINGLCFEDINCRKLDLRSLGCYIYMSLHIATFE